MTAMKQEVTRSHKGWALDNVITQNLITKFNKDDVDKPPPEGVYIYVINDFLEDQPPCDLRYLAQGLFLEGASLDRKIGKLVESRAKVRMILIRTPVTTFSRSFKRNFAYRNSSACLDVF